MCFLISLLFFLCVCECTFVPKNLDRVRGHWDINSLINVCFVFFSFCRVSVTCVCSAHCMYVYIVNLSSLVYVDPLEGLVQSVFFLFFVVLQGCDHVAFCQLSNLWMKGVEFLTLKKKKKLQHLNVHVHTTVHEMLAYCVTYSLLQFDNDEFFFL